MSDQSPPNLYTINNRSEHDAVLDKAQGTLPGFTNATPTLMYVSSASNPACRRALPKVMALAESNPHVSVHIMELTSETTPMIKFGPQNTPIFILMQGRWCETVLGPDFKRVEGLVREKFKLE